MCPNSSCVLDQLIACAFAWLPAARIILGRLPDASHTWLVLNNHGSAPGQACYCHGCRDLKDMAPRDCAVLQGALCLYFSFFQCFSKCVCSSALYWQHCVLLFLDFRFQETSRIMQAISLNIACSMECQHPLAASGTSIVTDALQTSLAS